MDFAEIGLLRDGQARQEREEIAPTKEGQTNELIDGPEGDEEDEEKSDGPERIKVL